MAEPLYKVLTEAAFEAADCKGVSKARPTMPATASSISPLAISFAARSPSISPGRPDSFCSRSTPIVSGLVEMGGIARRRAVSASLRAARSCRRAVDRAARSRTGRAPRSAGRGVRVSGLFGLGQACCRRSIPSARTNSRSRASSSGSIRGPGRLTTGAWRRTVRSGFSQSDRHGGGLRQECARAGRAARHGLRLRRGGHADAARAKRQRSARAFSAPRRPRHHQSARLQQRGA